MKKTNTLLLVVFATVFMAFLILVSTYFVKVGGKSTFFDFKIPGSSKSYLKETTNNYFGPVWSFFWKRNSDNSLSFDFVTDGEILNYTEDPLVVKISDEKNIKILIGLKGYYFDVNGKFKNILIPLVFDVPDKDQHVVLVNGIKNLEADWPTTDVMNNLLEYQKECPTCLLVNPGRRISVTVIDNFEKYSHGASLDEYKDPFKSLIYNSFNYIKYNEDKFYKFLDNGDSSINTIIPFQVVFVTTPEDYANEK